MRHATLVFAATLACYGAPLSAQVVTLTGDTSASRPSLHADLRFFLNLDTGEAKGLSVRVHPFTAADGRLAKPSSLKLNGTAGDQNDDGSWTTKPFDLKQADPEPRLEVSADFASRGAYTTTVVLTYNGKRQSSTPVSVTLTPKPLSAELSGLSQVGVTRWPLLNGRTGIKFGIRETAGQPLTVYEPVLHTVTRKNGDQIRQADVTTTQTFDGCTAAPNPTTAARELQILPGKTCLVTIDVSELDEAGEYTAKLSVANGDAEPIVRDLPGVFVKESWLTALFFILAGSIVSFLIRRYTKESRPKLIALRSVADVRESLEQVRTASGEVGAIETRVFEGLQRQILMVERNIVRDSSVDHAAAMTLLQTKIGAITDWLNVGRALAHVTPPEIVQTSREQWVALAESVFLKSDGDATTLKAGLQKITADVHAAVKADLLARIDDFENLTKTFQASPEGPNWAADIDDVLRKLAAARKDANEERIAESAKAFQDARAIYFPISIHELERSLDAGDRLGFSVDKWNELKSSVRGELTKIEQEPDFAKKLVLFQSANRLYITAVVAALQVKIEELRKREPQTPEATAALDRASTALALVESAVNRGAWNEALNKYDQAVADVKAVEAAARIRERGFERAQAQDAASFIALPEGTAAMGTFERLTAAIPRQLTRSEQFTLAIGAYDTRLNLVLLTISAVAGLSALWLNDPVWGGWKSYMTAWLAGLGLQQAGGAAVDSVSTLTRKLTE